MHPSPAELRQEEQESTQEANPATFYVPDHGGFNHEHLRYPACTPVHRVLRGVRLWSKLITWFLGVVGLWVSVSGAYEAEAGHLATFATFCLFTVVLILPSLTVWGVCCVLMSRLFRWLIQPTRGPAWELSRVTGMVTLFSYQGRQVTGWSAPFHEFDAYTRGPGGTEEFWLRHRYSDTGISLLPLHGGRPWFDQLWALWDFLQNYMDVSQPLPDTPALERYRALDPTTAQHDQASGRPPRYWIDMDEETFISKLDEMQEQALDLNTDSRPDLMARYVKFPGSEG